MEASGALLHSQSSRASSVLHVMDVMWLVTLSSSIFFLSFLSSFLFPLTG